MPAAFAIKAAVQWVVSVGGSVRGEHHDTFSNIRSKGRDTRGACLVTQQAAEPSYA